MQLSQFLRTQIHKWDSIILNFGRFAKRNGLFETFSLDCF